MIRKVFIVCLVASLQVSCGEEPTLEQQIIGTINEMEELAEEGKRRPFMAMVAADFSGQSGIMTKDEFQRFMIMQWNVNQRLHFQLGPIHVYSAGPGMATAEFRGLITGGRGLIPDRGQFYEFHTSWLLDGDDWLLRSANWDPVRFDENGFPGFENH